MEEIKGIARVKFHPGKVEEWKLTGEVLGTPNTKMKAQLGTGEPKLFTPWMALHDQEVSEE